LKLPPATLFSVNKFFLESIFKKRREIIEAQNNDEIKNQKPPKRDSLPVIVKALTIRSMNVCHE